MYELMILSLLVRQPMHGYLITKIINDIIGPFARVSNGRLYPLLAKLEEQGYIELCEAPAEPAEGGRQVNRYRLTEAGRYRHYELMMDTTSNPGDYQKIFNIKVSAFSAIEPAKRQQLIEHYIHYCQAHILHITAEMEDLIEHHGKPDYGAMDFGAVIDSLQHRIEQWKLELSWVKKLQQRVCDCPEPEDQNSSNS